MKVHGKPLDLDYDVTDIVQAVISAPTPEKAAVVGGVIHDLMFRRDGGERRLFFQNIGPTNLALLRDMCNDHWETLYGEKTTGQTRST